MKRFPTFHQVLAAGCLCVAPLFLASCATKKDVLTTQTDLATVRGNIEGLETTIDKRQAGLSEEVLELKRSVSSLRDRDDELRQIIVQLQQRTNVSKIETEENLRHISELNREFKKAQELNVQNLSQSFTSRQKEMETGLADLRRQLAELQVQANDQNRRLGEANKRLNVFLEEVTAENERLHKAVSEISQNYNLLADKMNTLNKELVTVHEAVKAATVKYHVIAEGETLTSVASRYNLSVDELVRINGLNNPNNVKVGQKILLGPQ